MRRALRLAAVIVAATALAGCVRFTTVSTFSSHDTVTLDATIALTADAAAQVGIDPATLSAASLKKAGSAAFPGVDASKITIEDYTEGDRKGVHVIARDLSLDEFNAASADLTNTVATGLGTTITVAREGDTYVVTIPADPARDASKVPGGNAIGLLSSSIDFSITMEFPGPVRSATAGKVDGKKVVLGIEDLLTTDAIVIKGQATPGIAWEPILRWGGIAAAGVVIVGGAAVLVWQDKRRQRRTGLPAIVVPDAEPSQVDGDSPEVM